jgi:hypothetical protein
MRHRLSRTLLITLLAASGLAAAGCAARSVNQIIANPSRYSDREVRVSGTVTDSYSLANRGAYQIDDGTGQLWVVSDRGVPAKTARVTVTGTIRTGFSVGSLGDRLGLPPGLRSGLVLVESSHKARD